MPETEFDRVLEAYLEMAGRAEYRPEAPSDHLGNTLLTEDQVADPLRLSAEAESYARRFIYEEASPGFPIGGSDFETTRALVYTIEAARALCGAGCPVALKLLEMAAEDLRDAVKERP